jgi:hypothetical protein
VSDRVHFLSDVGDAELPLAYALADVYVGVSRLVEHGVEGFGIALLEASASGKPVVAGRSGGMPDAVRENETGLLVDPKMRRASPLRWRASRRSGTGPGPGRGGATRGGNLLQLAPRRRRPPRHQRYGQVCSALIARVGQAVRR